MGSTLNMTYAGGGKAPAPAGRSDVNFYDYDGSIVASYTAADFASLSALPKNPTHDGLTAQGWNYTLADAKAYVASYGKLDVGQMYITDDGKTRIYIKLEERRLAPYLGIAINGTATVEWGDGQTSTVTGSSTSTVVNTQHTYAAAGDYVIAIAVSGSMVLMGNVTYGSQVLWKNLMTLNVNRVYQNVIQKAEIGANTSIGSYAFKSCYSLASITIPSGVTSIDTDAFADCYTIASITIPSGVTSIGNTAFAGCANLESITIPSSVTSLGSAFQSCRSLTSITIPSRVTSIVGSTFTACSTLASITIPSGVTSIGQNAFQSCSTLASITIPSGVTSIGNSAFQSCYSLASITIPSGVTSIGTYAFSGCYSLASITIPSRLPSISNAAVQNCYSLASITIPSWVTSIGASAFYGCYGLGYIKFERTTPPTVSSSSAWSSIPTDCIIYVPSGTLSAYTGATNYPSSSTYTYVEY